MTATVVLLMVFSAGNAGMNYSSFNETVVYIEDGWTMTDSSGRVSEISLPYTVSDVACVIETKLPKVDDLLMSPTIEIYSNYTDVRVIYDGSEIYFYPEQAPVPKGTGNTYHYLRLPDNSAGKTLRIEFAGQLGDSITYLLRPVGYGSRANMLHNVITQGLPIVAIASCMVMISVIIIAFSTVFRHNRLSKGYEIHLGIFTLLFSVYIVLETKMTMVLVARSTLVYTATFVLLALLSIPIFLGFMSNVDEKFRKYGYWIIAVCWLNYTVQITLHFTGVANLRAMMPITHAVMIISICAMTALLILSGKAALNKCLCAFPVGVGGIIDIILLAVNKPSPNNNFFFSLGVIVFIISQFCQFISSYLKIYKDSIESSFLRTLAFTDVLTGLGSRTAYERTLADYKENGFAPGLFCMVADINCLKMINDEYGHSAGDTAIKTASNIILSVFGDRAQGFRTGGDEFVVFVKRYSGSEEELVSLLQKKAADAGRESGLPFSLAVGCGRYRPEDGSVDKFVSRIDALMYEEKRRIKESLKA